MSKLPKAESISSPEPKDNSCEGCGEPVHLTKFGYSHCDSTLNVDCDARPKPSHQSVPKPISSSEPNCTCEGEFPEHCGPECDCFHHKSLKFPQWSEERLRGLAAKENGCLIGAGNTPYNMAVQAIADAQVISSPVGEQGERCSVCGTWARFPDQDDKRYIDDDSIVSSCGHIVRRKSVGEQGEAQRPPRPKLQGGDYRPHYPAKTADPYMYSLEQRNLNLTEQVQSLRRKRAELVLSEASLETRVHELEAEINRLKSVTPPLSQPSLNQGEPLEPVVERKLLIAAYDALRSYQHGNNSEDLAQEVADSIGLYFSQGRV